MVTRGRLHRWTVAVAVVVGLLAAACGDGRSSHPVRPTIAFLGDSITYGIVRGAPPGPRPVVDPQGGYPGRLGRRLGDRARVLNRGIGGATTTFWLATPDSKAGRAMWALVRRAPWFEAGLAPPRGPSVAVAAIAPSHPDVVVVLLGVNDLYVRRGEGERGLAEALDGLETLARQLRAVARTVLVATPLPNHRDPPALVVALAAGIRARFPDALPLGERMRALDWEPLLADEVHLTPAGYARLAAILEDLLVERDLVAPRS